MFWSSNTGTAIKAAAAVGAAVAIAAALWYVFLLRGQMAEQTRTIADLRVRAVVAGQAEAQSPAAAQEFAVAMASAQLALAAAHQSLDATDLGVDRIDREIAIAPLSAQTCLADSGLPVAYMRVLDRLFDAPAFTGDRARGRDRPPAAAGRVPGAVPAVANSAKAP
jgi:hypothetical protein